MNLLLVLLCVIFAAALGGGQVLFKLAAGDVQARLASSWVEAVLSPWLIAALLLYAVSTALWLYILAQVPLTRAYPFVLLGAALVPLLARLTLSEPLPAHYIVGMAVVLAGVAITQLG